MVTSQAHLIHRAEALFQRRTSPRSKLLALVMQRTGHFSAEEISRAMPQVGRATVYRTLGQLVEEGLVVPPRYLPAPFADLNALSAWMCFSGFLNNLSLERVEADYANIL